MDPLTRLQDDIAAVLSECSGLAGVPIYLLSKTSDQAVAAIVDQINQATAGLVANADGKSGLALCVVLPGYRVTDPDAPGPQGLCEIIVQCIENTTVNGGENGFAIGAFAAGQEVIAQLHHHAVSSWGVIYADERGVTPMGLDDNWSADLAYEAVLTMPISGRPKSKASPPLIVADAETVIMGANGSATIMYSIDDSYPRLTTGIEYTGPFERPPAGTLVRAVVHQAGKEPSSVADLLLS